MTAPTPGQEEEAELAALAFQAALTVLGAQTVAAALALWRRISVDAVAESGAVYLRAAIRLVMASRRQARDLAIAYYRLNRALRTGATIPHPDEPTDEDGVTLGELREEFRELVSEIQDGPDAPVTPGPNPPPPTPAPTTPEPEPAPVESEPVDDSPAPETSDDTVIPIEEIPGVDQDGDEDAEEIEREAAEEARVVLAARLRALQLLLAEVQAQADADEEARAAEVDAARQEAVAAQANRQAASVSRLVQNGGRSAVWSLADRDKAVIGYVRVSQTGTPCGFCAMLISRGPVYRTEASASLNAEGDLYHDNCQCAALPVYSRAEYRSPRYDLNRQYERLWPEVTQGYSGKSALSVWRRFIRQEAKAASQAPAA